MNSDPKHNQRQKGRRYEWQAEQFLIFRGFRILERNWQAGHKEIDLIAVHDRLIVFVEVKAGLTDRYGHPAEWVDRKKQENLISAARQYILEKNLQDFDFRFDLITFFEGRLEHFPDAFQTS
nr:YraN family protein [candidate division Zixibacteria bacterium]